MITRISHKNINKEKYTSCIRSAFNYRIYAEIWYLDAVTNFKWDCLVYEDYKAVLPLPYVSNLGFKVISQPVFCQQLGVFYSEKNIHEILQLFLEKMKRLPIYFYQFNEENLIDDVIRKKNHLLVLDKTYEEIRSSYRKNRKYDVNYIGKKNLTISSDVNFSSLLEELNHKYHQLSKYYRKENFRILFEEIIQRKCYTYYSLKNGNEIISSVFFVHSRNRRILLLSTKNADQEYKGASGFLIDYFIRNNCNSDLILDFEGSSIPGIADFYESFGAVPKEYCSIVNSRFSYIKFIFNNSVY